MSGLASTDAATGAAVISLPNGGGAITGLGETFTPDLFTGTGSFVVPIDVPAGRLGVQPQLRLAYSTGSGNGPWGLGWQLSLPGVSRKTSRGVPHYRDESDVFLLSGAEDLVPVAGTSPGRVRYQPRTEGLFARIEHVRDAAGDFWEVRTKDGQRTRYGTPRPNPAPPRWRDPAVIADPAQPGHVAGWRITQTADALGNQIRYDYLADEGDELSHRWRQPLISTISYADYGDRATPSFLVTVEFDYEDRPDAFSSYRAGFEVRTSLRCRAIRVVTHAADGVSRRSREYRLSYQPAPFNGTSLLASVTVVGLDDEGAGPVEEPLAPLTFGYTTFDPTGRRFTPVTGPGLPTAGLDDPTLALVDLRGVGLHDVVQLGPAPRVWRNGGNGTFELPRTLPEAPSLQLGTPGVQFLDADGDGRPDLVVAGATSPTAGYFPMAFDSGWSHRSFRPYRQVPSVGFDDPRVRLIDLDGDGLTDVLLAGDQLESFFNDPDPGRAWQRTAFAATPPEVNFTDPRIRVADMTGDGLDDIVLIRNGNVAYWPNLGHGRFGPKVAMHHSPRLPDRFDPARLLLGDVDGDGVADLVYVDNGRVLVWGNRSGDAWTEQPVTVAGTPLIATDTVRLADLYGTGMAGILFSRTADGSGRPNLRFLDLVGGQKPYLLAELDNHLGAISIIHYGSSTQEFLRDRANRRDRWRTTLPFPVQVVARIETVDALAHTRTTSEFRYHHGYWDGYEREFRGFGMVERFDAETSGGSAHFSPPALTRTWFHLGPVAALVAGDWTELDLRDGYWPGDPTMLARPPSTVTLLKGLSRQDRRSALRALRGHELRTELYARDGSARSDRPYTVTENVVGIREESAPGPDQDGRVRIFFPFGVAQRTTQWERGTDPMTRVNYQTDYDRYGFPTRSSTIAVPRGRDPLATMVEPAQPYLATLVTTEYAQRDDTDHYLVDRVARATGFEVINDGRLPVPELAAAAFGGALALRVTGHSRTFYDGDAFVGLPIGVLGEHGLPVRAESLAFTDGLLRELYPDGTAPPVYLNPNGVTWTAEYPAEFRTALPPLAGYRYYRDGEVTGSPGGFYVATSRLRYDVHDAGRIGRGLTVETADAMDARTHLEYDPHDLLPARAVDAAGLDTAAVHDPRVLRARQVTDANGTVMSVTFSPYGFVTTHAIRGSIGEGDRDQPSTVITRDLLAFVERGQPASTRTQRRVHHDTETGVAPDERDQTIVTVVYSDGFGRDLQTRQQAQDVLFGDPTFGGAVIGADQLQPVGATVGRGRGPSDVDNVVVSGAKVYDNKGRVVERFEPFYSTGFAYAEPGADQLGQKSTLAYDPRGQLITTVHPDGSVRRLLFGIPADLAQPDHIEPTPWECYIYDANDNAGRTHPDSAGSYQSHWNTPQSLVMDGLERTVSTVARAGADPSQWLTTRSEYDIQGHLVAVTDPLARTVFRYALDQLGRRWRVDGIDTGRRDTVPDALDRAVEGRDSKGALSLEAFDALHRTIRVWARDNPTDPVTLRQRLAYGDAGTADQPPAERAAARTSNLLGRLTSHHDEAGLVTVGLIDFKGNVVESVRRVVADAPLLAAYQKGPGNGWEVAPFRVDWTPAAGQTEKDLDTLILEPAGYATTAHFDALNRTTRHQMPADVSGHRAELRAAYDRSGKLAQVQLDDTVYVRRIAYDAKGNRALIAYGNGVMTRYAYDPHTFRLVRLRSEHYAQPDPLTYQPVGAALQDSGYQYDLAGNLLGLTDRSPGSGITNNPRALLTDDPRPRALLVAGDALDRQFGYDPLYRLISASGREFQAAPAGDPWLDQPRGSDITQTQPYVEKYGYDAVGSLLTLEHSAVGGSTRVFTVAADSNRLTRMTVGKTPYDYTFDANGNQLTEAGVRRFGWDHADRLSTFATQTRGAEPSVHAQYLYDSTGLRVKKLVRRQGGAIEVTHYLDEVFEHHRWSALANQPGSAGQNNHLHVLDDRQRIALVRVGRPHPDDRGPAEAVHLADHLGSSNVIVDQTGAVVNREEFTPYGETSFGSFARKRYRFLGQERDEESSLVRTAARAYSPWTARWASCEPLGGLTQSDTGRLEEANAYWYGTANPMRFVDADGRAPNTAQRVPPGDGTDAHEDILPVLAERLGKRHYDARIDDGGALANLGKKGVLTAPGGSISGKSRGELDLLLPRQEGNTVTGHVYELKPARLVTRTRTDRQVNRQVKFGQKLLHPGLPVFYKAGTILQELDPASMAAVFAPIPVDRGTYIRVYSVGLIPNSQNTVEPGKIGYSYQDVKKRQDGTREDQPELRPIIGDRLKEGPDPEQPDQHEDPRPPVPPPVPVPPPQEEPVYEGQGGGSYDTRPRAIPPPAVGVAFVLLLIIAVVVAVVTAPA